MRDGRLALVEPAPGVVADEVYRAVHDTVDTAER
jgi:hypothetical protein